MSPQQYYDQLVRAGMAGAVFADVRRGKALAALLERVTITDSAGDPVSLDDAARRGGPRRPRPRTTTATTTTDGRSGCAESEKRAHRRAARRCHGLGSR